MDLASGSSVDIAVGRGSDNSNFGSGLKVGAIFNLTSVSAPSYQLSRQFPVAVNPANGWTLGFKTATNGALVPYSNLISQVEVGSTFASWRRVPNDDSQVRKNLGPSDYSVQASVPVGGVNLVPGSSPAPDNYAVARFIVPSNSTYRVTAWASPSFPSGQGDTDFHVLVNNVLVKGAFLSGSAKFGYTNQLVLSSGDTVEIASGRGADNNASASYLNSDLLIEPIGAPGPVPDIGFSPAAGPFTNQLTVALVNNVGAGQIRLTVNGADPTASSSLYTNSFVITASSTIRAGLFLNGFPISGVHTAAYSRVIIDDVQFIPTPGVFTNQLTVKLTNTVGSGQIRFTINGSDPTGTSPLYTSTFTITSNATIRAGLFLNGFPVSLVYTGDYGRVYALDDGVPNSWRLQYFGAGYLTDPRVGAGTDADGDGSSNLQEYLAGTDPLNPLSGFTIGIQAIPRISFVSVPGTTYKILRRDNANSPTGVEVGQVTASGTQTTFIDTSVTNPTGFYTVQPLP